MSGSLEVGESEAFEVRKSDFSNVILSLSKGLQGLSARLVNVLGKVEDDVRVRGIAYPRLIPKISRLPDLQTPRLPDLQTSRLNETQYVIQPVTPTSLIQTSPSRENRSG